MLHRLTTSVSPESRAVTGPARRTGPHCHRKTSAPRNKRSTQCHDSGDQKRDRNTRTQSNHFVCPQEGCGYAPPRLDDLKKHLRIHSGDKPFVCPRQACGYSSSQAGNLSRHKRTHSSKKRFVCTRPGCGRAFRQSSSLTSHLLDHTTETGPKLLVCTQPGCGRAFTHSISLTGHLRTHARKKTFVCPRQGCGRSFAQAGTLTGHLRIHSGARPFRCFWEGCGWSFRHPDGLTKHRRRHLGEKPFVCPWEGCGRAFTQSSPLKSHLRLHTGEKPFACPWEDCGYLATQANALKYHLCAVHSGARPFVCSKTGCGRSFIQAGALTRHLRTVHPEEKPFACPREHCAKRFDRFWHLKNHLQTHTAETPYYYGLDSCKRRGKQRRFTPSRRSHHAKAAFSHACQDEGAPCRDPDTQRKKLPVRATVHAIKRSPHARHYPECNGSFLSSQPLPKHLRCQAGKQALVRSYNSHEKKAARQQALQSRVLSHTDARYSRCSPASNACLFTRPSPRRTHRRPHAATGPSFCPAPNPGTTAAQNKIPKPHHLVHTSAAEAPVARASYGGCGAHSPCPGPARGKFLPAVAAVGSPALRRDLRDASPGTGHNDSAAPSGRTSTGNQKSYYRSVIAWISGGVVYQSPPPAQQHSGWPKL